MSVTLMVLDDGKEIRIDGRLLRVGRLAAEQYDYITDPDVALANLRTLRARMDVFTFLGDIDGASRFTQYAVEPDNLAVLRITTFDDWWTKQINGKTRNMIRKAEKNHVTVHQAEFNEDLVAAISTIYNESPFRQGKPFWHYGKPLEAVRQENGTFLHRSVFIIAAYKDEVIGFAKLVLDERRRQAGLMQILSMLGHRDKSPTNALVAESVRICATQEIPNLVYAKFSYGQKQQDSLAEFKLHNGFKRVEVPRYYAPLTIRGRVALRLGLHRPIKYHIPEAVLARLRTLRKLRHAPSPARNRPRAV